MGIPIGVPGHEPVAAKQRMRPDQKVYKQPLGRASGGAAAAKGIRRKTGGSESPDVFSKIKFNRDGSFLKDLFSMLEIDPGDCRKLDEYRAAYHERSFGANS